MKNNQILRFFIFFLGGFLITNACGPPPPPICLPFQNSYSWGPHTSDGDLTAIEDDLRTYLNQSFPPSECPEPNPNNSVPNATEVKKCNPFPTNSGLAAAGCLVKEYIIPNKTGGFGSVDDQYPSSIISGCDLKQIADNAITEFKVGHYCSCQGRYASVVPDFEVAGIATSNSGIPANPVKRAIYINVKFRCCGNCK